MNKRKKNYIKQFFNLVFMLLRIILIVVLFPFVVVWCIKKLKKKKELSMKRKEHIEIFDMTQIDSLSGIEFEKLLNKLFELQGYNSVLTKKSHDYGADLVLEKKGKISIVQAKCYGHNVGIKAVQEIVAAKEHYKAQDLFVATNRNFSKDAIVLAIEHGVKLIDREVLFVTLR